MSALRIIFSIISYSHCQNLRPAVIVKQTDNIPVYETVFFSYLSCSANDTKDIIENRMIKLENEMDSIKETVRNLSQQVQQRNFVILEKELEVAKLLLNGI